MVFVSNLHPNRIRFIVRCSEAPLYYSQFLYIVLDIVNIMNIFENVFDVISTRS